MRSAVAGMIVAQALTTCLIMALMSVALLILGVAVHPNADVGERMLFLVLGCVLLSLCAAGLYFGVLEYWIGCVRWYRYDGRALHYRTVFSASIGQRLVDELELVVARRPTSHQAEAGSWRLLRFLDGEQLKLHVGILQNATVLYERLKARTIKSRVAKASRPASTIDSAHPLWHAIQPHLEDGEQVWWIGRPVYRKLWSEMAAEVNFGLIPGTLGLVAGVAGATVVMRGDSSATILVVIGTLFTSIGCWCIAAPYRYRRMLRDTVYAITSHRALILGGFTWGPQVAVVKSSNRVQSFTPSEAVDYEVVGRGRDIVFGGEWRRGRRSSYWGHHGFLAADDRPAAEAALRCLLSRNETGC